MASSRSSASPPVAPSMDHAVTQGFSLVRGGPMHTLQNRLRLLGNDGLPTAGTGVAFAAVAWLPLALLCALDPHAWSATFGASFFTDFGSYARYLVAIFMLIIIDRQADDRLNRLLSCFVESGIVARDQHQRLSDLLHWGDCRTASTRAELCMLAVAYALAVLAITRTTGLAEDMWLETTGGRLGLAGWWALLVSMPLFLFLVLRWLWRLGVWTLLLRDISRLPLQLVATHPDRAGGLGFLTLFPMIFVPFTLTLSIVVASAALQEVVFRELTFNLLRTTTWLWIGFIVALFFGPLAFFSGKLLALREESLVEHSEIVSRYHRAALESLAESHRQNQPLDAEKISAMADLGSNLSTIYRIKLVPAEYWALVPLAGAALLPMLMVASLQVPLLELLQRLTRAFL